MGNLQLFSGTTKPTAGSTKGSKQWEASQAEEEEQLGVCYKDEEYSEYFLFKYIFKKSVSVIIPKNACSVCHTSSDNTITNNVWIWSKTSLFFFP